MNKNYRFIDKTYQQSNSMLLNILILYFAKKEQSTRITTYKNEAI